MPIANSKWRQVLYNYNAMNNGLYIIGNGFDKAHSMPVCYLCFKNHLENNKGRRVECEVCPFLESDKCCRKECFVLTLLNSAVSNNKWSNFEEDLAFVDYRALKINTIDDFDRLIDSFINSLQEAFIAWINSIIIPNRGFRKFCLDDSAFYVCFNYTMTLEDTYSIPSANVLHIHGSYKENVSSGRKYVFGHSSGLSTIQNRMRSIIQNVDGSVIDEWCLALMRLKKDTFTEKRILHSRLDNLQFNNPIIRIIGHSFSPVDYDYFSEINKTFPCAKWIYYYHSPSALCDAKNNINSFQNINGGIDISYEDIKNIHIK